MDEFLKLKWRNNDLTTWEPEKSFISEDVVENSSVYKFLQNKAFFKPDGKKAAPLNIFKKNAYIPGQRKIHTFTKSTLDEWAHEQCLKALKLFQSGKDPSCFTKIEQFYVDIFKKLNSEILKENSKFQSYVLEQWQKIDGKRCLSIKHGLVDFGKKIWEEKWKRIFLYSQFYKEKTMINTTFDEEESIIDFKCISNVLDLGTLARFSSPNLKSPCHLKNVTLPVPHENKCVYSNLAVSQDQNVTKILESHPEISLAISASSLKCIIDNSDPKKRWMIPVIVKEISVQNADGSSVTRNVVFLDKPFSQYDISYMDFVYISYKRLTKTNFCQFEAFNYATKDSSLKDEDKQDGDNTGLNFNPPKNRHHNVIHHNASYRIWNIKKTFSQNNLMKSNHKPIEFNVLVRSKLDACECNELGSLQPVIIRPKLEMQLKYGANIATKSELAREWTSLFFTPFSNLYRVRIAPTQGEVICVEKCKIQKVLTEAHTHYQYKPQLGLGILQIVFEALQSLKPGKYLLQHLPKHEAFISVMEECNPINSKEEVFDLHADHDEVSATEFPKFWVPIDINFILPSFEAANRMPGMFTPRKKITRDQRKKKTKSKGASNKQ